MNQGKCGCGNITSKKRMAEWCCDDCERREERAGLWHRWRERAPKLEAVVGQKKRGTAFFEEEGLPGHVRDMFDLLDHTFGRRAA